MLGVVEMWKDGKQKRVECGGVVWRVSTVKSEKKMAFCTAVEGNPYRRNGVMQSHVWGGGL